MKKIFLIIIILSFYTYTFARSPEYEWTTQDTILQSTFTAITIIDWLQTWSAFKHEGCYEGNPILGKHPSQKKVNILIGSGIIAHAGVSYLLPKSYRTIWQSVFIGIEAHAVYYNYLTGIRINF